MCYAYVVNKKCSSCTIEKKISDFYIDKRRNSPRSICKKCQQGFNSKWRTENEDAWKQINRKSQERWRLKNVYRISEDELKILKDRSDGQCEICKVREADCIDHCHRLGIVRGLLCDKCNLAIGLIGENIATLNNAIEYLNDYNKP